MILLVALACDAGGTDSGTTDSDDGGVPFIALVSPVEDEVVCRDPLPVVVEVDGLVLAAPPADVTQAEPGAGHIDVTLNGQDVAMVWETEFAIEDWAGEDGLYQLKVELSNADHTAVKPYAGDFVYVTLSADACQ